jgi:hypothetical protein
MDQMRQIMMSADVLCRAGIFGAVVFLGLGSQAIAQVPKAAKPEPLRTVDAEPNSTVASFGDWVLRCQRSGSEWVWRS